MCSKIQSKRQIVRSKLLIYIAKGVSRDRDNDLQASAVVGEVDRRFAHAAPPEHLGFQPYLGREALHLDASLRSYWPPAEGQDEPRCDSALAEEAVERQLEFGIALEKEVRAYSLTANG